MNSNSNSRSIKGNIVVFFAIMCFFNMAASFAHPVTPTLIIERDLDSSMFGVALATMMTVNFLFAPFWGKMCSYIPTKTIMLIGAIGYAIGQTIFGAATSEAMVMGGRAFAGIFTSASFIAFSNYVVNTSQGKDTGSRLTIYVTIQNVCGALGYFIGGMLGLISVEAAFTAQVAVLAGCGVLFFIFCKDDTEYKKKPDHKLTFAEANPFAAFLDIKKFITPSLAMLFVIVAICAIGQNSYEQVFNYYIKDHFGMSSAYNGIFKAVIAFGGMLINSTLGLYLMKKTDTNISFLWIQLLITIPAALTLLFFENVWPFAACDIAFFILNTARLPLMQNLCAQRATPETSNSIMGFYQGMNSLGGIFGAAFAGLIYDTNTHVPFILCFAAFVIGSLIGLKYVRDYKNSAAK